MKLGDIIDLDSLQEIQDCFAQATGFAAIAVDLQGKPLLKYSGFSNFCSKLREDPYFNEKCRASDAHISLEAVRRNEICTFRCHAGLVDFAIPIIVDGEYVASMMCGQVLIEDGSSIEENLVKKTDDIFEKHPELKELYDRIPVLTYDRVKEAANLLFLTLNYIVEQYLLNQNNIRLLSEQKDKIELEKQFKDLEIKYYHSQVNPHFLFNALNVAGRQAFLEGASKTQDIIYALADIYRYYLNNSGFLISVEEEIQNIKNYMFIQRIRFGELLTFTLNLEKEVDSLIIPAMSLQIFVENAVRHGLEKKEDLGHIVVTGYKKDGCLTFEVTDNGIGIPEDKLKQLNDISSMRDPSSKLSGLGIHNVHKRLNHFFPENYSLTFKSNARTGTKVALELPAVSDVDSLSQ